MSIERNQTLPFPIIQRLLKAELKCRTHHLTHDGLAVKLPNALLRRLDLLEDDPSKTQVFSGKKKEIRFKTFQI
jgi:hypothetical protein